MANTKGIRLYAQESSDNTDERAYATKDVSGLAIILPFTITIRCRIADYLDTTSEGVLDITAQIGGASNNLYQRGVIYLDPSGPQDSIRVKDDQANFSDLDGPASYSSQVITLTLEDWVWFQLELNTDNDLTIKYKDDNTTTKPTSWDATETLSGVTNITPTQELQTVVVQCGNEHGVSSTDRIIFEIDEIYVEQN